MTDAKLESTPQQTPVGSGWSRERRIARVLSSQGMAVSLVWTFSESEQDRIAALCSESGGICVDCRGRLDEVIAARNKRIDEEQKATAE